MKLTGVQDPLPERNASGGDNLSPGLDWSGAPEGTRAFVLVCEDPDAPGSTFVHWLIYDLPGTMKNLNEGVPKQAKLPGGIHQGLNDFGRAGYDGPAPPPGPYHRYYFRLYALSAPVDLPPQATAGQVRRAMEGKVLAEAEAMGRYRKVAAQTARMSR